MVQMRRCERQMRGSDAEALLHTAQVGRLGLCDAGRPYVVPVHFVYLHGAIYVHSASEGRKVRVLQANPCVCVEVDEFLGVTRGETSCQCGTYYRSVIASCTAEWITDTETKRVVLTAFTAKYAGGDPAPRFTDDTLDDVTVIALTIDDLSGKQRLPPARGG